MRWGWIPPILKASLLTFKTFPLNISVRSPFLFQATKQQANRPWPPSSLLPRSSTPSVTPSPPLPPSFFPIPPHRPFPSLVPPMIRASLPLLLSLVALLIVPSPSSDTPTDHSSSEDPSTSAVAATIQVRPASGGRGVTRALPGGGIEIVILEVSSTSFFQITPCPALHHLPALLIAEATDDSVSRRLLRARRDHAEASSHTHHRLLSIAVPSNTVPTYPPPLPSSPLPSP